MNLVPLSKKKQQKKNRKDRKFRKAKYEATNPVCSKAFLSSYEWRKVRLFVLKRDGAKCACCGATPATGAVMNVDHIKPRKRFPHLALDPNNLQVLCQACNHGKGNWDMTDFRDKHDGDIVLMALDRIKNNTALLSEGIA